MPIPLPFKHWHMLAIGGVGMSAVAKVLKHFGAEVTGSDLHDSAELARLRKRGMRVCVGHDHLLSEEVEAVVYSSAIRPKNPEIWQARSRGIGIFHRAEVLSDLLHRSTSVGVTGTHGKTTTSACISYVLHELGLEPTCLVGGEIRNVGDNVILGSDELMVSEIDESDQTQELVRPSVAVITNIEPDHLDQYINLSGLESSFERFMDNLRDRWVVISGEDASLNRLTRRVNPPLLLTYGFGAEFDCAGSNLEIKGFRSRFKVSLHGQDLGWVELSIPGAHNASNALAVIAAAAAVGVDPMRTIPVLKTFKGAGRRLEVLVDTANLMVVDDYAHHPTEVAASLRSLRALERPLTVIYQPHRYSRTELMAESFAHCFADADRVIITDIYAADEAPVEGISCDRILKAIKGTYHRAASYMARKDLVNFLNQSQIAGEIVAFLGAGDIGEIAHAYAERQSEVPV